MPALVCRVTDSRSDGLSCNASANRRSQVCRPGPYTSAWSKKSMPASRAAPTRPRMLSSSRAAIRMSPRTMLGTWVVVAPSGTCFMVAPVEGRGGTAEITTLTEGRHRPWRCKRQGQDATYQGGLLTAAVDGVTRSRPHPVHPQENDHRASPHHARWCISSQRYNCCRVSTAVPASWVRPVPLLQALMSACRFGLMVTRWTWAPRYLPAVT